jgi:hypothetical protein
MLTAAENSVQIASRQLRHLRSSHPTTLRTTRRRPRGSRPAMRPSVRLHWADACAP